MTTTQTYADLIKEIQQKVDTFPMHFAFSNEQFLDVKEKLNVKDNSELLSIGNGGYIRKDNRESYKKLWFDIAELKDNFLKNENNLLDAFMYELGNHEFQFTGDYEPTLSALGLEVETLTDKQKEILTKAHNKYIKLCIKNDWY